MSQLENDLNNEVEKLKESFNAGDIIKGLIILSGISAELAALLAVVIATLGTIGMVSGGLGYLGIPLAAGTINLAVRQAVPAILKQYSSLNKENRKVVRMALTFLGVNPNIFG
jgi:hypothetical protein